MISRRSAQCRRSLHERRRDNATAAAVELALLYCEVFGTRATGHYLLLTDIPPDIAARILHTRRPRRRA